MGLKGLIKSPLAQTRKITSVINEVESNSDRIKAFQFIQAVGDQVKTVS